MPERLPLGGYFALDPSILERPPRQDPQDFFGLQPGRHLWPASGRAALRLILQTVDFQDRNLLLPDFLCGRVLLDLLNDMNIPWRLYPVKKDLQVDWRTVHDIAGSCAAVLAINYFGVVDQGPEMARFKEVHPEVATILDCALDPFYLARKAKQTPPADFVFASFRKALPMPDGAVLIAASDLPELPLEPEPDPSVEAWLAGALLKHSFVASGGKVKETLFVEAHERAKSLVSNRAHPASLAGLAILERLDLAEIIEKRRSNYKQLAAALPVDLCQPLVPELADGAVPTHLPVMVKRGLRDALRSHLAGRAIFCPVHWPQDPRLAQVGDDSQALYQNLISLVIDQTLGGEEIRRIAEELAVFAQGGNVK